jgi:hypothetical protein
MAGTVVVDSKLVAPHNGLKLPSPPVEMSSLPSGFPAVLASPLAWTGQQFEQQPDFIHHLDAEELREIDAALKHFKGMPTIIVNCSRPCSFANGTQLWN